MYRYATYLRVLGQSYTWQEIIANYLYLNQSESVVVQRIYTHFKKTPPTHKLGVLYVVDSVTRGWVEQAKKAGQTLGQASPPPGTYAAGVSRVTELLPSFMNDMINNAPEEQKVRYLETSYQSKERSASRCLTYDLLYGFSNTSYWGIQISNPPALPL